MEDQCLISELQDWLMGGKLIQTTLAHVLATSPAIHKELVEKLQVHRVEVNVFESYPELDSHPSEMTILHEPDYSLLLLEIDMAFNGSITEPTVLDPSSQIVVIRKDLAQEVNTHINPSQQLEMEGANGTTNWTLGCAKYLNLQVRNVPLKVHAHVVEKAPFCLLLS
jgi:hypothetical protein